MARLASISFLRSPSRRRISGETGWSLRHRYLRRHAEDVCGKPEWKMPWLRASAECRFDRTAHPERTVFTRFIPAAEPRQGAGMWRRYYERWDR